MRMPTKVNNYLKRRLFEDEYKDLSEAFNIFSNAIQMGRLGQDHYGEQLDALVAESDSQFLADIIRARRTLFAMRPTTNYDRRVSIAQARWFSTHNNNIKLANRLWTSFAMGVQALLVTDDARAAEVLDEFQEAPKNANVLGVRNQQEISNTALNEGELLFVVWYEKIEGKAPGVQLIETDKIEIIYDPVETQAPVYYKYETQKGKFFFPDVRATDQQRERTRASQPPGSAFSDQGIVFDEKGNLDLHTISDIEPEDENGRTYAVALHAMRNVDKTINRGMPQFDNGFVWADVLQNFMGDIAAVARKAAMYTDVVKIDGGSRQVKSITEQLASRFSNMGAFNSNPASPAGSDWIENEALSREWMSRPTGASDWRWTGQLLAGQLSVVTGVPMHWMGFPYSVNNVATADNIIIPWLEEIKSYNIWLVSVFHDLAKVVLWIYDQANGTDLVSADVTVTMKTPMNIDVEFVIEFMNLVINGVEKGVIASDVGQAVIYTLMRMVLTKLGVSDADTLVKGESEFAEMDAHRIEAALRAVQDGKLTIENAALIIADDLYNVSGE